VSVQAKICGLTDAAAVAAAVSGGARYAGFVFCPDARRRVSVETAAALIAQLPSSVIPVGLFVNAGDDEIANVLKVAPLRLIQLHGDETPWRVLDIKRLTGLPSIKSISVAERHDVEKARIYQSAADMFLFDARPPIGAHRGGNGVAFNWDLLKGERFPMPWLLAGGLTADNVAAAVAATGARIVDVSSGVEDAAGRKNPMKIKDFLAAVQQIETSY